MRRLVLWMSVFLILSGALLSGIVFAKYRAGRTVPLPLSVQIRRFGIPKGADYVYDGTAHGISFDASGISWEGAVEKTDAGDYTAVFTLRDPVASCWEDGSREEKRVTWKIVKRPIVISSESAQKSWDGTALTNGNYALSSGKLPSGSFANVPAGTETLAEALAPGDDLERVSVTGSQTNAGNSDNTVSGAVIRNGAGTDVTANYSISYVNGKLTVDPVPIDLPPDASYKWNGSEQSIGFASIASCLREAAAAGFTVLDPNGNDVTQSAGSVNYFDGTGAFKLYGTGAWNQTWIFKMNLQPDANHYWSAPLHGEVTDRRTVTLQILPELGNARDVIIAAEDCSMVDGFSASGLAGLLNAPIISVKRGPEDLSEEERARIARITSPEGARVWIMGGINAVSQGIEDDLRSLIGDPELHITSVQRLSGRERFSTAWHIFEAGHGDGRITEASWNPSGTVIILPGENVEPTLSIMTYAYASRTPVLLAKKGVLSDFLKDTDGDNVYETRISAEELLASAGFKRAILVGPSEGSGSTFISAECEAQLRAANPSVQIMRINGNTIGSMTNAICAWMVSSSSANVNDPNVERTGNYTYVSPEAAPVMKDSGRVVSISDYASLFREIDVLGDAHLYVRTSANLPYYYTLTLSNGDQDGEPVLSGFLTDDSISEVYFGSENGSPLMTYRPQAPDGYVFIGFGAPWKANQFSYANGLLSMTLKDSYLGAVIGRTRQAVLYALYVERGKDPSVGKNRLRYRGSSDGGTYSKTLVDASDCRLVIPSN